MTIKSDNKKDRVNIVCGVVIIVLSIFQYTGLVSILYSMIGGFIIGMAQGRIRGRNGTKKETEAR